MAVATVFVTLYLLLCLTAPVASLGQCTRRAWFEAIRANNVATLAACVEEGFPIDSRDELGYALGLRCSACNAAWGKLAMII